MSPSTFSGSDLLDGPLSRREEKKLRHRAKIIEAAREVFFRDGFVDANLDEVAQLSGLAKGTLYGYFENKGELYLAVLAQNGEIFEDKLREAISSVAGPADRLRAAGRFYLEHWTAHPQYFRIFWAIENESLIGDLPPEVMDQVRSIWENCLRRIADLVQQGVDEGVFADCDAWEVANILWTVAHGMIQTESVSTRRDFRRVPVAQLFHEAIELILKGLSPTAKAP